jgi:GMP synthase (glutamine-hydrolysing)
MDSGDAKVGDEPESRGAERGAGHGAPLPLPVLVILHQEHSTPGHVGRLLLERGHALDIRRPRYGDPLPATLAGHAGTVIFGGPMSANDTDEYVRREIGLVELALREQSPFLGICLGAQMMAACLGARVAPDPDGHVEMGYYDVVPEAAATIGGPWPTRVYHWHSEGFDVPAGAEPLVRAEGAFPNQALRYGPAAIGLQFHPEITYAMAARWSGRNEAKLPGRRGAQLRHDQLADHIRAAPAVQRWLTRFLDEWLVLGRTAGPTPGSRSMARRG